MMKNKCKIKGLLFIDTFSKTDDKDKDGKTSHCDSDTFFRMIELNPVLPPNETSVMSASPFKNSFGQNNCATFQIHWIHPVGMENIKFHETGINVWVSPP